LALLGRATLVRGVWQHGLERLAAALVAYLALEGPTPRTMLASLLWPDRTEDVARANLRQRLKRLRDVAGADLISGEETLRLPPDLEVDVVRLESLAFTGEYAGTLAFQGEFLFGYDYADCPELQHWVEVARARLAAVRAEACGAESERLERAGDLNAATALTEQVLALDPYAEGAYRRVMRLRYLGGDRSGALQDFERCKAVLRETFGAEPLPETLALGRLIAQGKALTTVGHRAMPVAHLGLPRLVGRERELQAARGLLQQDEVRLVTFTGPGGCGKTQLALAVATSLATHFADGALFVDLAALRDERLLEDTLARALGAPETSQTPMEQVVLALRDRHMLLLLDNLEQLLPAAARLSELLGRCPRLKLLVTSRAALRVRPEHQFPVPPLEIPTGDEGDLERLEAVPSVRLFLERVRAVDPGFCLTLERAGTVARICQRLDGLPLAIELAAPRLKLLSPEALLAQLEGRLGALQHSGPDRAPRQQTLRDEIAWSYALLGERAQAVLRSLGVFAGSFEFEAALAVGVLPAAQLLEELGLLVDHSLVQTVTSQAAAPRFRLLQTIHEFALERLTEHPEEHTRARARHGQHYLEFLARHEERLRGEGQQEALETIEAELENIRLAWDGAVAGLDVRTLEETCLTLHAFYTLRARRREGLALLQRLVTAFNDGDPAHRRALGYALAGQAVLLQWLSDYTRSVSCAERALSLLSANDALLECDARAVVLALRTLGLIQRHTGNYDLAKRHLENALRHASALRDERLVAVLLDVLGLIAISVGQYDEALRLEGQALEVNRRFAVHAQVIHNLTHQGLALIYSARLGKAQVVLAEALTLVRHHHLEQYVPFCLADLGLVAYGFKRFDEAIALGQEALIAAQKSEDRLAQAWALMVLGRTDTALGNHTEAERTLQTSLRIAWQLGQIPTLSHALLGLCELRAKQGYRAQATACLEGVSRQQVILEWVRVQARRLLGQVNASSPPEVPPASLEALVETLLGPPDLASGSIAPEL
jgi:predicted ATPase/DNA-binding SARP family transcriptional activator